MCTGKSKDAIEHEGSFDINQADKKAQEAAVCDKAMLGIATTATSSSKRFKKFVLRII